MVSEARNAVIKIYFTVLLFLMYYFINETAFIGGIGITYRHLFALAVIFSAFVYFLFRPDVAGAVTSIKSALVFAVPLLVVLLSSCLVWIIDKSDITTIFRGISGCFIYTNWLSCALAAGAVLYVFGKNGIWYNLAAIVASNLLMILTIIMSDGLGTFMKEFFELIASFASNTGDTIVKAEIHELAFCLGAYIIYMLYKPIKRRGFGCFFTCALLLCRGLQENCHDCHGGGFCYKAHHPFGGKVFKKAERLCVNVVMAVCVVALIGYIWVIKADVFSAMEKAGIDTSGRAFIYSHVNNFYEFSPFFPGNGIGFLTYQLSEVLNIGVSAVHNDFLQFFVDLGFWGYILWLLSVTVLRTGYFGRGGDNDSAVITAMLTVYLIIVSSTDNTINYPLLTTTMGVIIMGNNYTARKEERELYFETHPLGV